MWCAKATIYVHHDWSFVAGIFFSFFSSFRRAVAGSVVLFVLPITANLHLVEKCPTYSDVLILYMPQKQHLFDAYVNKHAKLNNNNNKKELYISYAFDRS